MGLLASLAPVRQATQFQAMTSGEYDKAFWGGDPVPEPWLGARFGVTVSPELALTLTYVYSACAIISDDFGTMTCQGFATTGPDSRERIKYSDPGIGALARMLRWQPNAWQTAKAFWSTLAWQFLLRKACYAEIVYRPGLDGFVSQLVPRHPDRVREARLPSGRIQYTLLGEPGGPRTLTQDEMFVVRNTSTDGLNAISRIEYAGRALQTALKLQDFTHNYFTKGATAALLASYKDDLDDEGEAQLHGSITRYMQGSENAGGVLLVPADIDVKALGVDPEKSQLLGLKNLSGRDVARLYKMPPSWLGIEGAAAYNSQVQDATNYVNRCQVPMCVEFEQAIQRDLVIAVDLGSDVVGHRFKGRPQPSWRQRIDQWLGRADSAEAANGPSLLDVVAGSINIMQVRIARSRLAGEPADVLIAPRLAQVGLFDYHCGEEAIEEGMEAVRIMQPAILRALEMEPGGPSGQV